MSLTYLSNNIGCSWLIFQKSQLTKIARATILKHSFFRTTYEDLIKIIIWYIWNGKMSSNFFFFLHLSIQIFLFQHPLTWLHNLCSFGFSTLNEIECISFLSLIRFKTCINSISMILSKVLRERERESNFHCSTKSTQPKLLLI